MRAAALKYGHNNVVCFYATFATNHLEFPLYTALLVDNDGNGLPMFEVLSESTSCRLCCAFRKHRTACRYRVEGGIQAVHSALQANWRPSYHMADDAQAEIQRP